MLSSWELNPGLLRIAVKTMTSRNTNHYTTEDEAGLYCFDGRTTNFAIYIVIVKYQTTVTKARTLTNGLVLTRYGNVGRNDDVAENSRTTHGG